MAERRKVLVEFDRSEVESLVLELETPPNTVPLGPRTEALNTGWIKLRAALDSTQQQFDLSSFRKELEQRLVQRQAEHAGIALRGGWDDYGGEAQAEGRVEELEWVLALLPGAEQ